MLVELVDECHHLERRLGLGNPRRFNGSCNRWAETTKKPEFKSMIKLIQAILNKFQEVLFDGASEETPLDGASEETPLDGASGEPPFDGASEETPLDGTSGEAAFDRRASEWGAFDTWLSESLRSWEGWKFMLRYPIGRRSAADRIAARNKREQEARDQLASPAEPSGVAKASSLAAGDEGSLSRG